jgi:hypothetical protein
MLKIERQPRQQAGSEYGAMMRRLDSSESRQVQRVANLLAQALSWSIHPEFIADSSRIHRHLYSFGGVRE